MWQRLPELRNQRGAPPLFFNFTIKSSGYDLLLTDLTYLWRCSQSRQDVIREAKRFKCSIDPTEDSEQHRVLLSKIKDSLAKGSDNQLVLRHLSGESSKRILLTTKLSLPSPLRPLVWEHNLIHDGQSEMSRKLVRPLLEDQAVQKESTTALLQHVKDKDHVIRKLIDKIEASGIDLGSVFPGVGVGRGARKGASLEQVQKAVPGIKAFDERAWRSEFTKKTGSNGILEAVLGGPNKVDALEEIREAKDEWWGEFEDVVASEYLDRSPSPLGKGTDHANMKPEESVDDFEVGLFLGNEKLLLLTGLV